MYLVYPDADCAVALHIFGFIYRSFKILGTKHYKKKKIRVEPMSYLPFLESTFIKSFPVEKSVGIKTFFF